MHVPEKDNVTLSVHNLVGQKVATLVEAEMTAGMHSVTFDASNHSSGIYSTDWKRVQLY